MEINPGDLVKIQGSKGLHKVVRPDGGGHVLEDPHGNEVWVPNKKIIGKVVEEPKVRRPRTNRGGNATDGIPAVNDAFLAHLRTKSTIELIGPEKHRALFAQRYEEATGRALNGQAHMSWTCPEATFTYSLRIKFPTPEDLSIMPSISRRVSGCSGVHEVYNNVFIFELFRLGFDLGRNGTQQEAS